MGQTTARVAQSVLEEEDECMDEDVLKSSMKRKNTETKQVESGEKGVKDSYRVSILHHNQREW